MSVHQFLSESVIAEISREDKIFILVIGGSASGKNYVYDKNFSFPLVDNDKIARDLSGDLSGDHDERRRLVSKCISIANKSLERSFTSGESVAQVSTGSSASAVLNKFKKARAHGFKTALILVDTDPEVAIKRNHLRASQGTQGLVPEWKLQKTHACARETFSKVRSTVDYSLAINN